MKLSNSIKLSMANFSLFWKILIYKVIAFGIIFLLFLPIMGIINECLTLSGFFESLNTCLGAFASINLLMRNLYFCMGTVFSALSILTSTSMVAFVYLIILVLFIAPFLLKFSDVPASESVYGYMSSLNKHTFVVNFLDSFGKSAGYSALKTLLGMPFSILLVGGLYGILSLSNLSLELGILVPILVFAFVICILSFKTTITSAWVSSIVVFNLCAGKAFKKGSKAVARKFWSTLSSFCVVTTVMLAIIYMFSLYSLIVIIPLWSLIVTVFGQVLFFESQGMNYYVLPDNIVKPRKLEQADSMRRVKDII